MADELLGVEALEKRINTNQSITASFLATGEVGLERQGGAIYEEFLTALVMPGCLKVYKEMSWNDSTIGAVLFVFEELARRSVWPVEAGGTKPIDIQAKEFIEECKDDMEYSWNNYITEILSKFVYGWSLHEIIFKIRRGYSRDLRYNSKYNDGKIAWRSMPGRSQHSWNNWVYDTAGTLSHFEQLVPSSGNVIQIPMSKCLLFRTRTDRGNPEGRALALDTLIPTPNGWTTMKNIKVGDTLYDAEGKFRYVTAKSKIWKHRPTYKITFTAGDTIITDENHLWNVSKVSWSNDKTLSTKELFEWLSRDIKKAPSFCVGKIPIIEGQKMLLPVNPYILGYWLGDGTHTNGTIAIHKDDYASLKKQANKAGFVTSFDNDRKAQINALKPLLRNAGVLGNKHIPQAYLRADKEQRLALLQGLMDSDGTAFKGKDRASKWYSSNKELTSQFCELIRTLGGRPHTRIHSKPGKHCGVINGKTIIQKKTLYEVSFFLSLPAHKLKRKLVLQDIKNSNRVQGNFIRKIEFIGYRDTVCIEVDSPDNLFLAGKAFITTHNSLLRNAYRAWIFKKNIEEIEAIGIERELAGLPMLKTPEGVDVWNPNDPRAVALKIKAEQLIANVRRDKTSGILVPFGWEFDLIGSGGKRQIDTNAVLNRYDQRIAGTMLADIVMLGADKVGSFALADVKKSLLAVALEAQVQSIADVFNKHAIPKLLELNNFKGLTDYPKFVPSEIESPDINNLADFLTKMKELGVTLFPDEKLETYLTSSAGLPKDSLNTKLKGFTKPEDKKEEPEVYKQPNTSDDKTKFNQIYEEGGRK